jgi:predicted dehydrogenase
LVARPDIDLVVICTPSGYHARQAIAALDAGKHVVVEKPVALCVKDARAMVARARERGRLLSVISQHRFDPPLPYVYDLIQEGRLGRPILGEALVRWYRPQSYYDSSEWRGTVELDGGALMNQAIHTIDLLRWLMGDVSSVSGATATLTHRMEAEDTGVAALRFASGALGLVAATTSAWPGVREELNLFFERGAIGLRGTEVSRWEVEGVPAPASEASEGGGESNPTAIGFGGHLRQWRDILEATTSGREPAITGDDTMATLALVLAVYESNRTGRAVNLGST